MLVSEFTSSIAAMRAGPAEFPIVELNVNNAPMLSTLGLTEAALEFPALPIASMAKHKQEIKNTKALFIYKQDFIFAAMPITQHLEPAKQMLKR